MHGTTFERKLRRLFDSELRIGEAEEKEWKQQTHAVNDVTNGAGSSGRVESKQEGHRMRCQKKRIRKLLQSVKLWRYLTSSCKVDRPSGRMQSVRV